MGWGKHSPFVMKKSHVPESCVHDNVCLDSKVVEPMVNYIHPFECKANSSSKSKGLHTYLIKALEIESENWGGGGHRGTVLSSSS